MNRIKRAEKDSGNFSGQIEKIKMTWKVNENMKNRSKGDQGFRPCKMIEKNEEKESGRRSEGWNNWGSRSYELRIDSPTLIPMEDKRDTRLNEWKMNGKIFMGE